MNEMWEILVPCNWNDGKPVRTRHHREWDMRVRDITGGLTILKPGVGQWVHDGDLYTDRVIPVRVMADYNQMRQIANITIAHYEQLAVMYYRVSGDCIVHDACPAQRDKFIRGTGNE